MSGTYTLGVRGCQHLGYAAGGMRLNKDTRWNQRVVDGHIVHRLTMADMLTAGVAGIIDGGDLFHFNRPLPRDVAVANAVDDLRAAAGVWGLCNSGNHDVGGGSDISASGVIHRPHLGMMGVFPDPARTGGIGPYPGLYEIHTAGSNPHLPDGIALHVISHYGLSRFLPDQGIVIDPQPLDGHVNLLFTHGVFQSDERLYHCIQPHGEERPIPPEWAERGWDATILSHFHTLGAVPGWGDGDRGQVWYTGSSLRRGFVDDPGPRGWLQVDIHPSGKVTITPRTVWQRPQHDLTPIPAAGLTVADLDDLITARIASVPHTDPESGQLTGDPGAILRLQIIGATSTQRQGLADLRGRYATLTSEAAHWAGVAYVDNATERLQPVADGQGWTVAQRVTDYATDLRDRYPQIAHRLGVPASLHDPVLDTAVGWADQINPDARITPPTP